MEEKKCAPDIAYMIMDGKRITDRELIDFASTYLQVSSALAFYSIEENYHSLMRKRPCGEEKTIVIMEDGGRTAREALNIR